LERGGNIPNGHNICPHCKTVYKPIERLAADEIKGIERAKRRDRDRAQRSSMREFRLMCDLKFIKEKMKEILPRA